jgi:hypothetical protein
LTLDFYFLIMCILFPFSFCNFISW